MPPFSPAQIEEALAGLPGWSSEGDTLTKTFEFNDFSAAIDFMVRAAGPIDEMDHHPEWTNVYNRVEVSLSSHDVGGVTERDIQLATLLDRLAGAGPPDSE